MIMMALLALVAWIAYDLIRLLRSERRDQHVAALCTRYRRRLEAEPDNGAVFEALGDLYRQTGRFLEAKKAYQGALDAHNEAALLDRTRYKLRRAERELQERVALHTQGVLEKKRPESIRNIIRCSHCTVYNHIARRTCKNCGALLPTDILNDIVRDKQFVFLAIQAIGAGALLLMFKHYYDIWPIELQIVCYAIFLFLLRSRLLFFVENFRRNPF